MVPVGVSYDEVALVGRDTRGHHLLTEAVNPGAAIENILGSIVHRNLDTGSIAAVANRGRTWLGQRPANSPKSNFHYSLAPFLRHRRGEEDDHANETIKRLIVPQRGTPRM